MTALEVSRNGKRLCVAGVGDSGVVDAHLMWNGRPRKAAHPHRRVGGLDASANQFLHWLDRTLQVGDVITIRVVEVGESDPPKTTQGYGEAKPRKFRK